MTLSVPTGKSSMTMKRNTWNMWRKNEKIFKFEDYHSSNPVNTYSTHVAKENGGLRWKRFTVSTEKRRVVFCNHINQCLVFESQIQSKTDN
jgi:hypothetical protein